MKTKNESNAAVQTEFCQRLKEKQNNTKWNKVKEICLNNKVKIILCAIIFLVVPSIYSCSESTAVTLTTPQEDGKICTELIQNSKTLKELDEAKKTIYKYINTYEEKVYEGSVSVHEYKAFIQEIGFVDAAINAQAAYIMEFGNNN